MKNYVRHQRSRMFDSDFFEFFSKVHPSTPFILYIPAGLFILGYALSSGVTTLTWAAAMMRPDLFPVIAVLSVPRRPRGPARPLEMLQKQGINNFYWQYFQKHGVAEAEFERDVEYFLRDRPFAASKRRIRLPRRSRYSQGLARLDFAAGRRTVRRKLSQDRLSRWSELVSQHRPQLGADGTLGGFVDPPADAA